MQTRLLILTCFTLFLFACDSGTDSSQNGDGGSALPPVIAGVAPDSAYRGDTIAITGTRFASATGIGSVTIGGATAFPVLWTDSLIKAPVPDAATHGGISIRIGTVASNAFTFFLQAGSPPSAPVLSFISVDSAQPGDVVRLGGRDFGTTQSTGEVLCSGIPANVTTWNDSVIQFLVPDWIGQASVVVRVNGRTSNSLSLVIANAAGPSITGISPQNGDPGQTVTIQGIRFGTSGTVTFNSVAAAISTWTDMQISAVVPHGATSGPVVVSTPQGTSNAVYFTVPAQQPPPTISSLSPSSGPPGTAVIIQGSNFGTTPGGVAFNGVSAVTFSWTQSSIGATVPAGATSGSVTITANGQTSNGMFFQVTGVGPVPTISDVRPNPAEIGDRLRIHGTNFGPETPVITISGVQGLLDEWRSDEIRVYVPTGAVTGPLVVTCGGRSSAPYQVTIVGTIPGGITLSNPNPSLIAGTTATVTISGGTQPYAIQTQPNPGVATAQLSGSTITLTAIGAGTTTLVVRDAAASPATATMNIAVVPPGGGVSFSGEIQPIFNANCTSCHGGSGGLFLTPAQSYANLVNIQAQAGCTSERRVLPGNASASVLYKRLAGNSCGDRMPRGGNPLPAADIQRIADWINQGALNN